MRNRSGGPVRDRVVGRAVARFVVRRNFVAVKGDAKRRGLHRVAGEEVVPDFNRILAIPVTIGAGVIRNHEKAAAAFDEIQNGGFLRRGKNFVRLIDHEHLVM